MRKSINNKLWFNYLKYSTYSFLTAALTASEGIVWQTLYPAVIHDDYSFNWRFNIVTTEVVAAVWRPQSISDQSIDDGWLPYN